MDEFACDFERPATDEVMQFYDSCKSQFGGVEKASAAHIYRTRQPGTQRD